MKERIESNFRDFYKKNPDFTMSCGGRFEVLGNHTDHNHGKCLAATCSLATYGSFRKREDSTISYASLTYGTWTMDISSLEKNEVEKTHPKALIRGIARYLKDHGYNIGGFDMFCISKVPSGAGVSSSASFEDLIAQAFNVMFNDGKIDRLLLCKASQYAEREYYGKMCGLLDQIGCAYGGLTYIDFANIESPITKNLHPNFDDYSFLIVNSGGSHAGLDHLYKALPDDMFKVAHFFGKEFLNDIPFETFESQKGDVIKALGEEAVGRAEHFYSESNRVQLAHDALINGNVKELLKLIDQSRESSTYKLKNMYVDKVEKSPLEACNIIKRAGGDLAAVKINGGGFAGSVVAFMHNSVKSKIIADCMAKYGPNNVFEISIRNEGPEIL